MWTLENKPILKKLAFEYIKSYLLKLNLELRWKSFELSNFFWISKFFKYSKNDFLHL